MKDKHTPRVSIGVPVYNGERYLAQTIDSVLSQTYEDFELIICDNASCDRTEEISRSFAANDKRIRYNRNEENIGAAGNYRRVFELSKGEYFRWANADDLFAPEGLSRCVEILDRETAAVLAYPKTTFIDDRGQLISEYTDGMDIRLKKPSDRFVRVIQNIGYVNLIYGLIRADQLRRTGLLRPFPGGDIPLVAELSLYGQFVEIPERLFFRRIHAGALSSNKDNHEAVQNFFDPSVKRAEPMTEWLHLGAHAGSIMRAPVGLAERARLTLYLMRMTFWKRVQLREELLAATRRKIRCFRRINIGSSV